jgi:hypothetical protein
MIYHHIVFLKTKARVSLGCNNGKNSKNSNGSGAVPWARPRYLTIPRRLGQLRPTGF